MPHIPITYASTFVDWSSSATSFIGKKVAVQVAATCIRIPEVITYLALTALAKIASFCTYLFSKDYTNSLQEFSAKTWAYTSVSFKELCFFSSPRKAATPSVGKIAKESILTYSEKAKHFYNNHKYLVLGCATVAIAALALYVALQYEASSLNPGDSISPTPTVNPTKIPTSSLNSPTRIVNCPTQCGGSDENPETIARKYDEAMRKQTDTHLPCVKYFLTLDESKAGSFQDANVTWTISSFEAEAAQQAEISKNGTPSTDSKCLKSWESAIQNTKDWATSRITCSNFKKLPTITYEKSGHFPGDPIAHRLKYVCQGGGFIQTVVAEGTENTFIQDEHGVWGLRK